MHALNGNTSSRTYSDAEIEQLMAEYRRGVSPPRGRRPKPARSKVGTAPTIQWDPAIHTGTANLTAANIMVLCTINSEGDPEPISASNPLPAITGTIQVDLLKVAGALVPSSGGLMPASIQAVGNALGNALRVDTDSKDFLNVKLYDANETPIKTDSSGVFAVHPARAPDDTTYLPLAAIQPQTSNGAQLAEGVLVTTAATVTAPVPGDYPVYSAGTYVIKPNAYETSWDGTVAYSTAVPTPLCEYPTSGTDKAAPAPQMAYPVLVDSGTHSARYAALCGTRAIEPYDYNTAAKAFNHEKPVHPMTPCNTGINGQFNIQAAPAMLMAGWQYDNTAPSNYVGPVVQTFVPILGTTDTANFGRHWTATSVDVPKPVSSPRLALMPPDEKIAKMTIAELDAQKEILCREALSSNSLVGEAKQAAELFLKSREQKVRDDSKHQKERRPSDSGSEVLVELADVGERDSSWTELFGIYTKLEKFKSDNVVNIKRAKSAWYALNRRLLQNRSLTASESQELCTNLDKLSITISFAARLLLTA